MSKRSNRVIFIAILLLITYQLISVAYTAWGSSSDLETDDDPLNINMTLQITTFSTDSRITGKLNFTACSNDTIDFVIFLPSAIGPSLVRVDSESYVKNTSTGLFEYTYKNPNFNGKCYSRGWLFPFDSYELVFILSFNENTEIERGDIPLTIFFEDRTYYSDWKIEQTLKEKTKNQVLNLVNYVAPNKEEMAQAIEENSLEKFFVVEGKILPFQWNFVKSISLLIPPISVACIIVIYFWKVERNLGRSIRLYTGISFSLTAYLLALRQYLPPTMTFLEIVVLILILTSTLVFIYDMFNVTKKKG